MNVILRCPRGHQWECEAAVSNLPNLCPVCGDQGETLIANETSGPINAGPLESSPSSDELPPPPGVEVAALGDGDSSPFQTHSVPPEKFDRYQIVEQIGRGGMGSVYLAHDDQLDRKVALKIPRIQDASPNLQERFRREARAAATLEHPNICSVYDVGRWQGIDFMTMAYIEGLSLADLVQGHEALPQRAVADLVLKLARALSEAHDKGVIHRDLKPANIMINARHEPIIMDFGLAMRAGSSDAKLTSEGEVMGTPAYMAPEQVKGEQAKIGIASDVYALGAILYELLTGRLPFEGSVGEVLAKVLTEDPVPPSTYRPELAPELESICMKALQRDPNQRFSSMSRLGDALQAFLGDPVESSSGTLQTPVSGLAKRSVDAGQEADAEALGSAFTSDDRATDLLAKLAAKLDSVEMLQQSQAKKLGARDSRFWLVGGSVVALLLIVASMLAFFNRPVPKPVIVRFTEVEYFIDLPDVTFVVDGKEVGADAIASGLALLPDREHTLVVKQQDQVLLHRDFTPGKSSGQVVALRDRNASGRLFSKGTAATGRSSDTQNSSSERGGPLVQHQPSQVDDSISLWTSLQYGSYENPFASIVRINGEEVGSFSSVAEMNVSRFLNAGWNTISFETRADDSVATWNSLHFTIGVQRTLREEGGESESVSRRPLATFFNGEGWELDGETYRHQLDPDAKVVRHSMHFYYGDLEPEEREPQVGDFVLRSKSNYGSSNASVTAMVELNGVPLTSFCQSNRQLVVTDLLVKGLNEIKVTTHPFENILEQNATFLYLEGPVERNTWRDNLETTPITWLSTLTGWTRNESNGKLINAADENEGSIERTIYVYLPGNPSEIATTTSEPELMVWTGHHYSSSEVPLHSSMTINGEQIGIFSATTRQSIASAFKLGAYNDVEIQTDAMYPASGWNSLNFYLGSAGRDREGNLEMSRLWWFKNGEDWKFDEGRLEHAREPGASKHSLKLSLYYAGMEYENQELQKGDYVLSGKSQRSNSMSSVTATVYVNGVPLNSFAGLSRDVVITSLLRVGENVIRIETKPVDGQLVDNDIDFAVRGPARYNVSNRNYDVETIVEFGSLVGWKRDEQTGQLVSAEEPGAESIVQTIKFEISTLP